MFIFSASLIADSAFLTASKTSVNTAGSVDAPSNELSGELSNALKLLYSALRF